MKITKPTKTEHSEEPDLLHGSILKDLWSVAWPMMLSVFFYTLYNIVDAFWVSKLSPVAIAAVSISQITLFIMGSLSMGITAGSGVLMAMNIGAKNIKEAERTLGQSFVLSAIAGVFFTAISLTFRNQLLVASGAGGEIFAPALEYFMVTAAGSTLFFILITIMFAFNAQGDTFTLTKLFAISTFVNLVLDPILIFGQFGLPALGISGAAYATLISQAIFIAIALRVLNSPHRKVRFHFYNLTFKWESVKQVLNIGFPAALTQVINPIGLAALMFITTASFRELGTVAFTIGNRIEFLGFLPAVGFGFGAMAIIGQSIGAGNLVRAKTTFRIALKYAFMAAAGLGVVAILFSVPIVKIFTTDPEITKLALRYIWIVGLSYGFLAASMVEASSFQAIGKSWPGFWIFFTRFLVVSIPLSYIATNVLNLPIQGIWSSIVAGNLVSSIVGYFWITRTLNKLDLTKAPVHK